MPNRQFLRRATLNGAGLALVASLACATPAAAQTMNVAETLAYINERCENFSTDIERTGPVAFSGTTLSLQHRYTSSSDSEHYSIDIRRVDIQPALANPHNIDFACGELARCIDGRDGSRRRGDAQGNYRTAVISIKCRDRDRVARAFKHLQQLVGGRIADPVDPFAN